jgi:hypothetical protein
VPTETNGIAARGRRRRSMKTIAFFRKIVGFLVSLGILAVVLTIVQPMSPEVEQMFRVGAGILVAVCLGAVYVLNTVEKGRGK